MIAQFSIKIPNKQPEIVIFQELYHTQPSEHRYFNALELKALRPAPPDNDEPEERLRAHGCINSEQLDGPAGKKMRWKEKCMDRKFLVIIATSE